MENFEADNQTGRNHEGVHPNYGRYLTANSIQGDPVINLKGEKLGTIKEVMLDLKFGKIDYLVLDFGGFLGIADKYFAIPFEQLELDPEKKAFILDISKETLEKAPGFDKNHWPHSNSHEFDSARSYWGNFMGPNTGI